MPAKTHSQSYPQTPTYMSWSAMLSRCYNKKATGYKLYGGSGIVVCQRWKKFENFFSDMGSRPKETTLDRINPYGNYEPSNCRWGTLKEQNYNRRNTRFLEYRGEKLHLFDWAKRLDISKDTITSRLRCGWSIERAFNERIHRYKYHK